LGAGQSKTIGAYILPLSNWIVIPLRRVIPSMGRFDVASFIAAYLLILAKVALLLLISGAFLPGLSWLVIAFVDLLDLTLSGLVGLVFASVILSWVSAGSQIQYLVSLLVDPLLAPIRKALPNFGALDLSPLALLLILQVLQIVLSNLR
jgi:YggT family protein